IVLIAPLRATRAELPVGWERVLAYRPEAIDDQELVPVRREGRRGRVFQEGLRLEAQRIGEFCDPIHPLPVLARGQPECGHIGPTRRVKRAMALLERV